MKAVAIISGASIPVREKFAAETTVIVGVCATACEGAQEREGAQENDKPCKQRNRTPVFLRCMNYCTSVPGLLPSQC